MLLLSFLPLLLFLSSFFLSTLHNLRLLHHCILRCPRFHAPPPTKTPAPNPIHKLTHYQNTKSPTFTTSATLLHDYLHLQLKFHPLSYQIFAASIPHHHQHFPLHHHRHRPIPTPVNKCNYMSNHSNASPNTKLISPEWKPSSPDQPIESKNSGTP